MSDPGRRRRISFFKVSRSAFHFYTASLVLFSHYWVLFKLLLTVLATIVLLLHMPAVSFMAGVAAETDGADLGRLPSELLHSAVGLLVLLVNMIERTHGKGQKKQ